MSRRVRIQFKVLYLWTVFFNLCRILMSGQEIENLIVLEIIFYVNKTLDDCKKKFWHSHYHHNQQDTEYDLEGIRLRSYYYADNCFDFLCLILFISHIAIVYIIIQYYFYFSFEMDESIFIFLLLSDMCLDIYWAGDMIWFLPILIINDKYSFVTDSVWNRLTSKKKKKQTISHCRKSKKKKSDRKKK